MTGAARDASGVRGELRQKADEQPAVLGVLAASRHHRQSPTLPFRIKAMP
eukprot:CAMPEP_0202821446 /NCGR_PEP_ID=MMETSP1389-20130828/10372_1 /ASSEMBLY_ACC=CAM_ASM_000865 /TAXON_ID=302021 /ORGANISM="Rhodomonas sp., Strain CCMP768" /LENGTH=49 /DNA_ID=CAMNT_0049494209 /DNA_START=218 /DNA_END=367 /DNA_ORIENTATION=-